MMINTATDLLADHCSNHIRITHSVMRGRMELAEDLLLIRMEGFLRGFAEGDLLTDEELIDACATLCSAPGPLVRMALTRAAHDEVIRIRHS